MHSPSSLACGNKDEAHSKSAAQIHSTCSSSSSLSLSSSSDSTIAVVPPSKASGNIIMPPLMKLVDQSRLRLSRLEGSIQSQEEIQSPSVSTKRLYMEEKEQREMPSPCANARAIATNFNSRKRRKHQNLDDDDEQEAQVRVHAQVHAQLVRVVLPVLPSEHECDTSPSSNNSETEQKEIPAYSSSHFHDDTNGRMTPQIVNDSSDGDRPCLYPPMKRSKIDQVTKNASEVDLFIRISPSDQTQTKNNNNALNAAIRTSTEKTLPVTNKKHITPNNTAPSSSLCSPTIGNKEDTNISVAIVRDSDPGNDFANSSTTESSSSSSSSTTTSSSPPAKLPSAPVETGDMKAAGKEGSHSSPTIRQQENIQIKSIIDKVAVVTNKKESKDVLASPSLTTGGRHEPHNPQISHQSLSSTGRIREVPKQQLPKGGLEPKKIVAHPTPLATTTQNLESSQPSKPNREKKFSEPEAASTTVAAHSLNSDTVSPSKKEAIKLTKTQTSLESAAMCTSTSVLVTKPITSVDVGNAAHKNSMSSTGTGSATAASSNPQIKPQQNALSSPNSESSNKRKRSGSESTLSSSSQKPKGKSTGRWTQEEHQAFLEGLTECGREWKKVALRIPTRSSAQIRSHAQKYFAKLQRDQETSAATTAANASILHSGELAANNTFLMTAGPLSTGGLVVMGEGGRLSGTIVTRIGQAALPQSVQRNVERIVANPRAVQREVEETMEALRERYRQLQQRLEERRRRREERRKNRKQQQQQQQQQLLVPSTSQQQPLSSSSSNAADSSDICSSISSTQPILPRYSSPLQSHQKKNCYPRKRVINLPLNHHHPAVNETQKNHGKGGRLSSPPSGDENSSVTSNVSSIAASRTDLGNEEIVALEVLGEALPRGDSINDFQTFQRDIHTAGGNRGNNSATEEAWTSTTQCNNENRSSSSSSPSIHGIGFEDKDDQKKKDSEDHVDLASNNQKSLNN